MPKRDEIKLNKDGVEITASNPIMVKTLMKMGYRHVGGQGRPPAQEPVEPKVSPKEK